MWLAVAFFTAAGCGTENVAVIEFVDVTPAQPRLGEVTTVRFRVLDFRGQPQAGVPVQAYLASDNEFGQIAGQLARACSTAEQTCRHK